ncbi:uncharacterized protein LOC101889182 isoform X2 [Musca domestica]|uniref:Uncharacterized protein LOC101889182 isoform X2 n=2 Tax=Musca domestica TaxID=7370 RepID=A0ABM3VJE7_MUSDO|nr:uncharacterized protein LOC101889182 isoform X2 [Musca domestica]
MAGEQVCGLKKINKLMWTQELVELLITKYQQYEFLYNTSHPHYADRVKRSNALFEICKELKEVDNNISEECIKKKIHTLRSQYVKELQKVSCSKKSGAGADDIYEPKLWCYSQLQFLKSFCSVRDGESNIPQTENLATTTEELYLAIPSPKASPSLSSPSLSSVTLLSPSENHVPRKRQRQTKPVKLDGIREKIFRKLDNEPKCDWLGKEVVAQLNYIKNEKIQQRTIWKIQDALREGIMEDEKSDDANSEDYSACSSHVEELDSTSTTSSPMPRTPDILQLSIDRLFDDESNNYFKF